MIFHFKKKPPRVANNVKYLKTFFAWYPVVIGNECRWLTTVTVECYNYDDTSFSTISNYNSRESTENVRFVDNKKKE